jgi:Flp pilus assembly protein TadD
LDNAISELRQALTFDPSLASAHLHLGITLRQTGDLQGTTAALKTAAQLDPNNPEASYQHGFTLLRRGELTGAVVALRRVIALKPNYSDAFYVLGQALQRMARRNEAAAAFINVDRLHRADAEFIQANTKCNLGLQDLAKGDVRSGREAFQAAWQSSRISPKPTEPGRRSPQTR